MRSNSVRRVSGPAALLAALVVAVSGCVPLQSQSQASPTSSAPAESPTPAASPSASALAITNADFHPGEVSFSYNPPLSLGATGGTGPYQWDIASGVFPTGLSLESDGAVHGDPAAAGTFNFTLRVADAAGATATATVSVAIASRLTATLTPACAHFCSVEVGCVAVCGKFGTLSGGLGPFTYSVLPGGFIPLGTAISRTDLSLTGTFTAVAKYWQFNVLVKDSSGGAASVAPTFLVFPHISMAGGTCTGNFGTGCTVKLKVTGGAPGGVPSVRITSIGPYCNPNGCSGPSGPPPAGYVLTAAGGYVTVSIPKDISSGYYATWTLVITDSSPCGPSGGCAAAPVKLAIYVLAG
jgi:hypothetical protein